MAGKLKKAMLTGIMALGLCSVTPSWAAAPLRENSHTSLPPSSLAHTILNWEFHGAASFNYRNIGAKPIEIEIENQVQLSDIFLRLEGPIFEDTPFLLEMALDEEGQAELYRFSVKSLTVNRVELELGRFLVPFGQVNELYRPDLYPLVTKPLLYASPGLDFVSRVSYPHPIFSSGYVDTGLQATYAPSSKAYWWPETFTFFLVNGLQESPIRGRRPLDTRTFLILDSVSGTDIDWGHEVNFLSDNNDTKDVGGRVVWHIGDADYPSPFKKKHFVNGISLSLSAMGGKYDIEDRLSHSVLESDFRIRHQQYRLTWRAIAGTVQAKWPLVGTSTTSAAPVLLKDRYRTFGHMLQFEFPFHRLYFSQQNRLIFRAETVTRQGPFQNFLGEIAQVGVHEKRRMNKVSGGINSRLSPNFILKTEYSLWTFDRFPSIYQVLFGGVVTF